MIQEQIAVIINKFKDNTYYQDTANKQNNGRRQSHSKDFIDSKCTLKHYLEENMNLRKKNKQLEEIIQKMMIDANKMHRYYQEIICQSTLQFQAFKEQFNSYKSAIAEERKEQQSLIEFLNKKIQTLNQQIINKQQQYTEILEKYELLQEKTNQVQLEESQHMKRIEKQLVRASMHHQEQKKLTIKEIQEMKQQLKETLDANQQLLNQNQYLKSLNQSLAHNIEYLKNRLYCENDIIHEERHEEDHHSLLELEKCDVESISRQEDRFTLQEMKMNQSQEINFNGQKQLLNISQHYSKCNRTVQFLSKQKQNYEFTITESNERKSFAKKRQGPSQNVFVRVGSMSSKKQQEAIKKTKSRLITQVKQFKMQQPIVIQSITSNPYKDFFTLLIQSQKLNSKQFDRIFNLDLSDLYPELVKKFIPFNMWQTEIRKALKQKLVRRK